MSDELLDARGVKIEPGDAVIYGYGVGRSVAMAEGEVVDDGGKVSVTRSGRVRIRIVRRSYRHGVKPVIDLAADRMVVLKALAGWPVDQPHLPPSPLPTQADEHRSRLETSLAHYRKRLAELEAGDELRGWELSFHQTYGWPRERFINKLRGYVAEDRRKLEALDGE